MENQAQTSRPSWDQYFINLAEVIGSRSTCDRGKSGCAIAKDKRIISTGYIGSPIGLPHCDEVGHEIHTVIHPNGSQSNHCIRTTHAEQNAICQAARFGVSLAGATLYCKMTPCYTCAKMIINTGIKRVVCAQDYHAGQRSKEVFAQAGVEFNLLNSAVVTYDNMTPLTKNPGDNFTSNPSGPVTTQPTIAIKKTNEQLAQIFIYDEFNPEDNAMLQALYSRSPKSVVEHVQKVKQTGSGKFMELFYIGYGHASIADCGSTTIFIEKVSTLADKAVQDWPLYSGQETSTRYIDMSKQPIVDPINNSQSQTILNKWLDFYINYQEAVKNHLLVKYPRQNDEDEKVYLKAIAARAFDIMRGFLPAGITTQLSWHTNLRQAYDKLAILSHHPLAEVKQIAQNILTKLKEKYPHSFSQPIIPEQENYRQQFCQNYTYYYPSQVSPEFSYRSVISNQELEKYLDLTNNRAFKTGLPHFLTELGHITFEFLLDYGSFRDLQRHRNGICRMPLITTNFGFNPWYLEQLPVEVRQKAKQLIEEQSQAINQLPTSPEIRQYYHALGFLIACRISYGLPETVYVAELRSGKAVHPTLRKIAQQMYYALKQLFPNLLVYCDLDPDDWDSRRGLQDIIIKNS